MSTPVVIDVVSDVVCPWCYVGKRRLEAAQRLMPDRPFAVFWRPFQLDPTIPKEGLPRKTYLERKFGNLERLTQTHAQLVEIAQCGHSPHRDQPERVIAEVAHFLAAHAAARTAPEHQPAA